MLFHWQSIPPLFLEFIGLVHAEAASSDFPGSPGRYGFSRGESRLTRQKRDLCLHCDPGMCQKLLLPTAISACAPERHHPCTARAPPNTSSSTTRTFGRVIERQIRLSWTTCRTLRRPRLRWHQRLPHLLPRRRRHHRYRQFRRLHPSRRHRRANRRQRKCQRRRVLCGSGRGSGQRRRCNRGCRHRRRFRRRRRHHLIHRPLRSHKPKRPEGIFRKRRCRRNLRHR